MQPTRSNARYARNSKTLRSGGAPRAWPLVVRRAMRQPRSGQARAGCSRLMLLIDCGRRRHWSHRPRTEDRRRENTASFADIGSQRWFWISHEVLREWTPGPQTISKAESGIDLSTCCGVVAPLSQYARFYTGVVVRGRAMLEGELVRVEAAAKSAGSYVVESPKDFPTASVGGCAVVQLVCDPRHQPDHLLEVQQPKKDHEPISRLRWWRAFLMGCGRLRNWSNGQF